MFIEGNTSGWLNLAETYRFKGRFQGPVWSAYSGHIGKRWRSTIAFRVGANADGFYLTPSILFRPGHPPLMIPWSDISMQRKESFLFNMVELRLGREFILYVQISEKLGRRIAGASGLKLLD